jgi:alanine racemase
VTSELPDLSSQWPARAWVDLSAVADNAASLSNLAPDAGLFAVIKADAYGHGILPVARTLVDAGADILGIAQLVEAVGLRAALGPGPRIAAWLYGPGAPLEEALRADVEIGIGAHWMLDEVLAAASRTGIQARVHLKIDTGMARGGFSPSEVPGLPERLGPAVADGAITVASTFSHLASGDMPDSGTTERQTALFLDLARELREGRVDTGPLHIAASSGVLLHPSSHLDMIRPGIALYGVSPDEDVAPAARYGLRPAMTLSAPLVRVREVGAGTPVGYGHTYVTDAPTTLGLVPVGYADGVPRIGSNILEVSHRGRRVPMRGRVSMDQVVIDLGPGSDAQVGERVVLFGDLARGEPSAWDWARAAGTIAYEILTSVGARVPRSHADGPPGADDGPPGEVGESASALSAGRSAPTAAGQPLPTAAGQPVPTAAGQPVPRADADDAGARLSIDAPTAADTRALAGRLAGVLEAGDLVVLTGPLGAGKTTFVQGLGAAMSVAGTIASPTFVIARSHRSTVGGPDLVHVDAYRLGGLDELDALDLDSSLDEAVTVVEWGGGTVEALAESRLEVTLHRPVGEVHVVDGPADLSEMPTEEPRTVEVRAVGPRWAGVDLSALVAAP